MATYLILDLCFIALAILAAVLFGRRPGKGWWAALGVLLLLTAVFDNAIIALGIVGYHTDSILGLFVGRAPIEDFAYPVVALLIIPLLWNRRE